MKIATNRRTAVTALTVAVVLAGCSSSPNDNGFAPVGATTPETEDSDAADDPEPAPEPVPEPIEIDPEVAAAYRSFVATADRFDLGEATLEQVLELVTDETAGELAATWTPAHVTGEGERITRPVEVTVEGDVATVVDCMHDTRVVTDEGGVWREVTAELHATDDGWKVADFSDWNAEGDLTLCLHPDDLDDIETLVGDYLQARFDSLGRDAAPEFSLDGLARLATPRLIEDSDGYNQELRDAQMYAVGGMDWAIVLNEAFPGEFDGVVCGVLHGAEFFHVADDELAHSYADEAGNRGATGVKAKRVPGGAWQMTYYWPLDDDDVCDQIEDYPHTVTY